MDLHGTPRRPGPRTRNHRTPHHPHDPRPDPPGHLRLKHGLPDPALSQRLESLDGEQVEALGAALLAMKTLGEFEAWVAHIKH